MTLTGILRRGVTSIDSSCDSLSILFFYKFRILISLRYLYDCENVRITCESVISTLVQYLVLRIPLLLGFILGRGKRKLAKQGRVRTGRVRTGKRKLAKQGRVRTGRVRTVPSLKTGERKEGRYAPGLEKESIRTMHQCEGTWFLGKGSPN
jgi:hypothetical protein